jgi:adenylate kinase
VNIILIGAQGSGKGTQADLLSQTFGIPHVSSGDLIRQAIAEKTELGMQAKVYNDRGDLVPDTITVALVIHRIEQPDCAQGVILDGFPRTVAQAEILDKALHDIGRHIDIAAYLEVPRQELLRRLSGRYICRGNQHVYNIYTNPPKVPGICDIDGSPLYQRPDDVGEAVQRRLQIFFSETILLLDYYRAQGKLIEVNGNQSIEQVHQALVEKIRAHMAAEKNE